MTSSQSPQSNIEPKEEPKPGFSENQVSVPVRNPVIGRTGFQPQPRVLRRRMHWLAATVLKAGIFVGVGLFLIAALGVAQRLGWISASAGGSGGAAAEVHDHEVIYTCPMHPQIRQPEPGRCPICGMELVPAAEESGGGSLDELAVRIEPAARRVANIQTAPVRTMAVERTIRSIGEIVFDESRLATITAWVDGRIERLFADYTGVEVRKGDYLVQLYSPDLYAAQVEYLVTRKSAAGGGNTRLGSAGGGSDRMREDSREKLRELGMTEQQHRELHESGRAQKRLKVYAPIGGTVIEKPKVEGEYVQTGDVIYRIADLSTVWLMLELFPDDVSQIRYGQRVEARVQSVPGEIFAGRVSFVDPVVDKTTRTVGVRVVIDNADGRLRPGDYASATIRVPVTKGGEVYDAELAGKWISPRHPQIVRDEPGVCPLCDIELVPTSELGFADQPVEKHEATVVPRDAVLMAGSGSVVYVETEPGRFEIRPVTLGPMIERSVRSETGPEMSESMAVILAGVEAGEMVATAGNFLIDSQMQLAGKPSVIDPLRAKVRQKEESGPLELEYGQPELLDGVAGETLDRLYSAYFAIQERLAADSMPDENAISELSAAVADLRSVTELPESARRELAALHDGFKDLKAGELEAFRGEFKAVNRGIVRLSAQVRGPQSAGLFVHFYCPMVPGGGGDWLQVDELPANPYFGSAMLRCGDVVHRVAAFPLEESETAVPDPEAGADFEGEIPLPVPIPVSEEPEGTVIR